MVIGMEIAMQSSKPMSTPRMLLRTESWIDRMDEFAPFLLVSTISWISLAYFS